MSAASFEDFFASTEAATQRPVADVMATDEASPMADDEFDDAVWLALCGKIVSAADLAPYPAGVRMYFATRMIECEIGNGGMGQVFDNEYDEFLDEAMAGYRLLGDEASAQLLGRAEASSNDYEALDALDQELGGPPWNGVPWSDKSRIAYVRAHRDEFTSVDL